MMKISRTLTTTVLTAGILAGGTTLATAPAQAESAPAQAAGTETQGTQKQTAGTQADDRRDEIISRAQTWVDQGVPYNWDATHPDPQGKQYRMDCSGFVSMAWGLDESLNTVTLPNVAHEIDKDELKPGDVLMKGGPGTEGANGHVVIFNGWANDDKTAYHALEENGSLGTVAHEVSYPYDQDDSFVPYRLNGL
ncbi:NlpC/P60 family protein [Brevibacterium spongiae]|uniref:C40 family peptidase n=1 Tax=Brevibacterium spongiae TaxID=2909672 RepID=A0ABY5SN73_9MICO|nr:NlpC/P60 family protein [Brevibacterium spongiae]UVI36027.1 C40 family peptidase [Brevibacterium spongiae]